MENYWELYVCLESEIPGLNQVTDYPSCDNMHCLSYIREVLFLTLFASYPGGKTAMSVVLSVEPRFHPGGLPSGMCKHSASTVEYSAFYRQSHHDMTCMKHAKSATCHIAPCLYR
jgi:hypothetical protein